MLTYLEGTRYKIQSTLLELDHKQRGTHPLAPHIQLTRDRNGLQQSILKVPLWLKTNEADGTGSVPVSANDDEYVNQFIEPATADVRNDAVIGSYTPVYNRSHSQLEMKSPCQFTAQSLTDAPKHGGVSNRSSTGGGGGGKAIDEIDRGIADGGSNQHDSDFGEWNWTVGFSGELTRAPPPPLLQTNFPRTMRQRTMTKWVSTNHRVRMFRGSSSRSRSE